MEFLEQLLTGSRRTVGGGRVFRPEVARIAVAMRGAFAEPTARIKVP
jgi:hypothetical protein